jgi:hypothetical protein
MSVFGLMETSMMDVVDLVRRFHGDYFICGLFLGLTKPSMGWSLLGLLVLMPTIVILKHPEWFHKLKEEKIEYVLLLLLLLVGSDIYAFHCLFRAMGLNLPL